MQVPLCPMPDDRRGVPAEVMQEVLTYAHDILLPQVLRLQRSRDRGAKLQPALHTLRDCAATLVAYQFCNRPGTAATLQVGDLTVDPPTQPGAAITMKAKRHKGRSLDRQRDLPIVTVPSAGRPTYFVSTWLRAVGSLQPAASWHRATCGASQGRVFPRLLSRLSGYSGLSP